MTVLQRISGPNFTKDGKMVSPRALVFLCDVCGEPASYGIGVALTKNRPGQWFCALHITPITNKDGEAE